MKPNDPAFPVAAALKFKNENELLSCLKWQGQNETVVCHFAKLGGAKLCTLFGVSPRQQPRDGGGIDFESAGSVGRRLATF
jgi:hypothetical protein